jgi:heat shock protein HtpX
MNMQAEHVIWKRHGLLNMLHTWLLVGGSLALFVACAWLFFGSSGIVFALIFGGVSLLMALRVSPQLVLRLYRAVPVSRSQFPAGHVILDQLSERAGLQNRPALYVLPSQMMNAFAVGRISESAICMTDQLIRSLTKRELAGVMAHEISHIVNEDIKVMSIADMVSRFTSILSTLGLITFFLNLPAILTGAITSVPWPAIALLVASPSVGGLLQLALSRTREYDADLGAVMLTGDPDGLASALVKLDAAQGRHWEGMVLPGGRYPDPSLLRTHPRIEDRLARLAALKHGGKAPDSSVKIPPPAGGRKPARTVPVIRPKWGRGEESKYLHFASQLEKQDRAPVVEGDDADEPSARNPLAQPEGRPRIHVRGGGVYW